MHDKAVCQMLMSGDDSLYNHFVAYYFDIVVW